MKAEWTNKDTLTPSETTSILVINTPKNCWDCHLVDEWENCDAIKITSNKYGMSVKQNDKGRPSWCPLKPLPSKKDVTVKRIEDFQSYSITEVADKISAKIILKTNEIFALGWNACLDLIIGNDCLDEITGEKE